MKYFIGCCIATISILNLVGCALSQKSPDDGNLDSKEAKVETISLEDSIPSSDYYYVVRTDVGIVIRADASNTFKVGRSDILPQSSEYLDEIALILNKSVPSNKKILVAGHTDRSGSKASNDRLSLKRAQSVMAELVKRGVSQSRLTAEGYGFDEPISDNSSDKGRAMNRRVEIIIPNTVEQTKCLCQAFQ